MITVAHLDSLMSTGSTASKAVYVTSSTLLLRAQQLYLPTRYLRLQADLKLLPTLSNTPLEWLTFGATEMRLELERVVVVVS